MCAPAPRRALAVRVLRGCRAYDDVARRMRATHEAVRAGAAPDALLLCEHAPTVTVGKRAARGEAHVKSSREALARAGIAFARADRGGDVTYHGPGQLTAYPVVSLRRARVGARAYVEGLERCVSEALRGLGIDARGGGRGARGGVGARWEDRGGGGENFGGDELARRGDQRGSGFDALRAHRAVRTRGVRGDERGERVGAGGGDEGRGDESRGRVREAV